MFVRGAPCSAERNDLAGKEKRSEGDTEISQICRFCLNRANALFRDLTEEELSKFGQLQVGDLSFRSGEVLYRQGDEGQAVYMIREGLIKLEQFLPDGSQRIVRLVRGGSPIALETMVGSDYQHQAVALRHTRACRLPLDVLQKIQSETPRLHKQLMSFWHASVSDADTWLTHLSTGNARMRMARLLLLLSEGADEFGMLSREDIGAMLGITTETASRTIAEFRRLKAITPVAPRQFTADRIILTEIAGI